MARRKSRSIFQRLEAGNNREMPIPIREQRAAATPRAEDRKAKETGERETPPCRRVLCVVWDVHHARSGIFRSSLPLSLVIIITAIKLGTRFIEIWLSLFPTNRERRKDRRSYLWSYKSDWRRERRQVDEAALTIPSTN